MDNEKTLDDFSTCEIIEHLAYEDLTNDEIRDLIDIITDSDYDYDYVNDVEILVENIGMENLNKLTTLTNINDVLKLEFLIENFEKIDLEQLEGLIKK
jgi:hypothetical protein